MLQFAALPIRPASAADLSLRAMAIAHELGRGAAYDAHYVALAERLDAECWTADGRLPRSAIDAYPFLRLLAADQPGG